MYSGLRTLKLSKLKAFLILAGVFLLSLPGCASRMGPQLMSDLELSRIRAGTVSNNLCFLFGVQAPCVASSFEVIGAAPTFSSCGSISCVAAASVSQTQTVGLTQTFKSPTTSVFQETSVSPTPILTPAYTPASAWWQREQDYLLRPKF